MSSGLVCWHHDLFLVGGPPEDVVLRFCMAPHIITTCCQGRVLLILHSRIRTAMLDLIRLLSVPYGMH